jgi:meiosis protein SPO22/ZIP4
MFTQIELPKLVADPFAAEELADVLYEMGKDELTKSRPEMAVRWLERALDVFGDQHMEHLSETAPDLKLSTLHLLIKSLLGLRTPDALNKTQGLLQVMEAEFGDKMIVSLLRLEVLAADSKPEPGIYHGVLLRLFRSIYLSRPNFKTIMHHLHKLRNIDPKAACKALDDFLTIRLFEHEKEDYVERAAVMRIWITTTALEAADMLQSLQHFFDILSKNLTVPFTTAATHAAQTLLWKVIESHLTQKRYDTALILCRIADQPVFSKCGEVNKAKLARKAMLCALGQNDTATAREIFFSMSETAQANPQSGLLLYKVALRSQDNDLGKCIKPTLVERANFRGSKSRSRNSSSWINRRCNCVICLRP